MRKSGKTTRVIDRCIQELFSKGSTYVYENRTSGHQNKELWNKFINRLELEHPKTGYKSTFGNYEGIVCYKVELTNTTTQTLDNSELKILKIASIFPHSENNIVIFCDRKHLEQIANETKSNFHVAYKASFKSENMPNINHLCSFINGNNIIIVDYNDMEQFFLKKLK